MTWITTRVSWLLLPLLLTANSLLAQERDQFQMWLELSAANQTFSDRSAEIGRNQAFLEFLSQDSILFRDTGPIDGLELYSSESFEGSPLIWDTHYIDISRDGDLGLTAGPFRALDPDGDPERDVFGHLVSIWKKSEGRWELASDMGVGIPGFLSLDVEPIYEETRRVLDETAGPMMTDGNTMESLVAADNLFGQSINFRGGQRALLRFGLENSRVYLPGMAPAVGAIAASSVYGAFLDNQLSTTNPISLTNMGGYLSTSKEMGYTYGIMETNADEVTDGFKTSYLRLWRFTASSEWRIAVEVLEPILQ